MRLLSRIALASTLVPAIVRAQSPSPVQAVSAWIALHAAPGWERPATDAIEAASHGWTRDALGSLVRTQGHGAPVRVIACGLDQPAYAISQVTPDGYLRVHMNGNGARSPLWDEFHQGQRIVIMTGDRARPWQVHFVPGVFGVRSTHLWRGGAPAEPPSTNDLVVDIGARSAADVARMGVQMLDPVFRDLPPWTVGDYATGPSAAARAGCAAVASAANQAPATGTSIFVISAQASYNWSGLTAVLARTGHVDSVTVVRASTARTPDASAPVAHEVQPLPRLAGMDVGAASALVVRARFPRTLVESVSGSDLQALFAAVASAAGVAAPSTIVAPRAMPGLVAERRDSLSREADLLARLTDRYAVSTHEGSVRAVVMSELPAWARARATVDSGGNIVVSAGPDRDTVVIMAHMDEVGLEVTNVLPNGMVALKAVGGFFPTLFAGQPALLHRDDDRQAAPSLRDCAASSASATRGVFVPEDSTRQRAVYAWFGDDPASLGIAPGMFVTGYKCAARLGDLRFTARSIDDRAGSTALLLAINAIDPAKLDHKVVFAWSTREEIGLNGAAALAAQLRTNVKRVYAIDTFVSSDSPLENQAFADTPIGQGAVARMLDNSSVTPPQDIQALVQLARAQRIPLQVGTTNGGNDGSEFTRYGAVDVPIGWPLRNSHSPAEVIDLRDVRSLWKLLVAIAQAPVPPFAR